MPIWHSLVHACPFNASQWPCEKRISLGASMGGVVKLRSQRRRGEGGGEEEGFTEGSHGHCATRGCIAFFISFGTAALPTRPFAADTHFGETHEEAFVTLYDIYSCITDCI